MGAAGWRAGSLLLQSMSRSCTQPGPVATNTTCFAGLFSHRLSGYCGNSMAISWAILSRVRRDWTLAEVAALVRCWTGQSPRLPVGFPMSVFTEIPTTVTAAELERLRRVSFSSSLTRVDRRLQFKPAPPKRNRAARSRAPTKTISRFMM